MPKRIEVQALYKGLASDVFESALDFSEMKDAMKGIATYEGDINNTVYEGQTVVVDVTLFGVLKTKNYTMHLETLDRENCRLQSREHGGMIKRWDHKLSVVQEGEHARWIDQIIINAGLNTFGAARFGLFMYKYRHKRRNALSITSTIQNVSE